MMKKDSITYCLANEVYLIVKPTHAHFQFLFIKISLKFLKILLHVSVIRPSSGSFQFLAKISLIKNTFDIPILKLAMWQHVCNTKYIIIYLVKFSMSVTRNILLYILSNLTRYIIIYFVLYYYICCQI